MKAVVFHGPKQVTVEDRPVPKRKWHHTPNLTPRLGQELTWDDAVQHPKDIIVKVQATALCGSYVIMIPKLVQAPKYL